MTHPPQGQLVLRDPEQSALRRFALDRIHRPELSDPIAIDIPSAQLDIHQEAGYGIFAAPIIGTAVIHFTPHAARWTADEHCPPNANACSPTAAWNSRSHTPTRANY